MVLVELVEWGQHDLASLIAIFLVDNWKGHGIGFLESLAHDIRVALLLCLWRAWARLSPAIEIHVTASICAFISSGHVRNNFYKFLVPDRIIWDGLLGWRLNCQFRGVWNDVFYHIVLQAFLLELVVQLDLHVLFFWCASFTKIYEVLVNFII